ncbi:MAG: hypothetical protein J0L88_02065 [Xanthomonadales bacterium]|nr:hypothetical protein [Xanthomonadales bacterium]
MKLKAWIICTAGLVAGGAAVAAAAGQPAPAPPATNAGVVDSGMRMYVDPHTGRLVSRPATPEQAAAAAAAAAREFPQDFSKIEEIHKADGSIEWIFNGQVDSALVATRGADGKLHVRCREHGVLHDHATPATGVRDDR